MWSDFRETKKKKKICRETACRQEVSPLRRASLLVLVSMFLAYGCMPIDDVLVQASLRCLGITCSRWSCSTWWTIITLRSGNKDEVLSTSNKTVEQLDAWFSTMAPKVNSILKCCKQRWKSAFYGQLTATKDETAHWKGVNRDGQQSTIIRAKVFKPY